MLHSTLEHVEISAAQLGNSTHGTDTLIRMVFASCPNLRSIHVGPDTVDATLPGQTEKLLDLLETNSSIKDVSILNAGFSNKNMLFSRLTQRSSLEALEIDLDPGLQLAPFLRDIKMSSNSFLSLRRLHVMCYPEIALALPTLLLNVEQLSIDIARRPDQPLRDTDFTILDDLLAAVTCCKGLQLLKVNIGLLATNFPSTETLPGLHGASLVNLAAACPGLTDLSLLVSEPGAIDASDISTTQFEQFCQKVPRLKQLSLKFHPQTAMALEEHALQTIGRKCPQLEVLHLKVALQLPNSSTDIDTSTFTANDNIPNATSVREGLGPHAHRVGDVEIDLPATPTSSPPTPLFPNLVHLAIARPQTVLSIAAASTYATSLASQSSSSSDPWLEEELVRSWAHSLLLHFPRLDVLEAWSDWTGQDNDSLNYFLPLEEPLASIWEFLSGVEQDLWDDGQPEATDEPERWNHDFQEGINFRGSGDWDRASLINEYPGIIDSGYLETYEEEPEDMATPIDGRHGWFTHADDKLIAASKSHNDMSTPAELVTHDLNKRLENITLRPISERQNPV
jgi:hypothetical protein